MLQLILNNGIKSVKMINKCIFKCICVFYTFSTMLLKTQCNMWNKVSLRAVEMWKKVDTNALLITVEKLHSYSDLSEQSITLSR